MRCRECYSVNTRVGSTKHQPLLEEMWQYRKCLDCGAKFKTICTYAKKRPGPKKGSKGTIRNQGVMNQNAILTENNVKDIRALARTGILQKTIAERYGLASSTINRIILHKSWTHVH